MKIILKFRTLFKMLGIVLSCCVMMTSQAESDITSNTLPTMTAHEPIGNTVAGNVLIFISFSMPIESLKAWSEQAQKIHAPLIIRGLLNDSFVETQKVVKQMTIHSHGGVIIDPRLFQTYHITQVPAVVVRQSVVTTTCLPNQSCWQPEEDEVVMGDVGLESALKSIAQEDNRVADIAQKKLAEWRAL
jgi:type-F conjugative transfer system pilin assembly protein TrbC